MLSVIRAERVEKQGEPELSKRIQGTRTGRKTDGKSAFDGPFRPIRDAARNEPIL